MISTRPCCVLVAVCDSQILLENKNEPSAKDLEAGFMMPRLDWMSASLRLLFSRKVLPSVIYIYTAYKLFITSTLQRVVRPVYLLTNECAAGKCRENGIHVMFILARRRLLLILKMRTYGCAMMRQTLSSREHDAVMTVPRGGTELNLFAT